MVRRFGVSSEMDGGTVHLLGGDVLEFGERRPSHTLAGVAPAKLKLEAREADAEVISCKYSDSIWSGF